MDFKNRNKFAETGCWAPVQWGEVLKITGEDAADFLQGQFSQDLRGRAEGEPAYGFWLARTGKVQGDGWVWRTGPEAFLAASRGMTAAQLQERLEHHIIADEVYLEDETAQWTASWWVGASAVAALATAMKSVEGGWCLSDPTGMPGGGAYALVPVGASVAVGAEDVPEVTEAELERWRITASVPRVPVDLGEDDLPQEVGLEAMGVSFNKGCYLGQEVMARLQAMGRTRRRLVQVRGAGAMPDGSREELQLGEKVVGTLRSRATGDDGGWIGLAMVGAALTDQAAGELRLATDGQIVSWSARNG